MPPARGACAGASAPRRRGAQWQRGEGWRGQRGGAAGASARTRPRLDADAQPRLRLETSAPAGPWLGASAPPRQQLGARARPPRLETSAQAGPRLETRAQPRPRLETSARAGPRLGTRARPRPRLEASARAGPRLKTRGGRVRRPGRARLGQTKTRSVCRGGRGSGALCAVRPVAPTFKTRHATPTSPVQARAVGDLRSCRPRDAPARPQGVGVSG